MSPTPQDIQELKPDSLLGAFSKPRMVQALLWALVAHVILIGACSVSTIRGIVDRGYVDQVRAAEKAEQKKAADAAAAAASKPPPATAPSELSGRPAATSASPAGQPAPDDNSPVRRRVTEMPKDGEIPSAPNSGLGLD